MNDKAKEAIRVAVLDDHQSMIDGYAFRLKDYDNIKVVANARYGDELEPMLKEHDVDLLLLDVSVPSSAEDSNPFPILHVLPKILAKHRGLAVLVISMHKQRTLVRAMMEAGARGYIVKEDRESIVQLGEIITTVAAGGVYFSKQSFRLMDEGMDGNDDFRMPTQRQIEALSIGAARPDMSTAQIAQEMNIAPSTARNLLSDAYVRLGVPNLASAVAKARHLGLISPYPPEVNTED